MRRDKPEKREILPDIRYNSVHVQTMVQHVVKRGKKSVALGLVYGAMDLIQERTQNPEQAEEALQRLPDLMKGVLAEDFRPNPEADCMWCKFKPLCPLWSEGKELPA